MSKRSFVYVSQFHLLQDINMSIFIFYHSHPDALDDLITFLISYNNMKR